MATHCTLNLRGIYDECEEILGSVKTDDKISTEIIKMINCPTILTGMSHEMRTHMNSIVAFSFLLNNTDCNEKERKEFSNHILSSCEQLMVLFDNFLDSAIIDTGNSKAEPRSCNLGRFMDDLLAEFRVILNREEYKDIVLILENQAESQFDIRIDTDRLTRVMRNLFQNSLTNTKSGYIKIGYRLNGHTAEFFIKDSGSGYRKCREFLQTSNLNESLSRHNDTSAAINLTLARKLVTLMEGSIRIENNGNTGTSMFFTVPVRQVSKAKLSISNVKNINPNTSIAI